jgi:hypothetical protein
MFSGMPSSKRQREVRVFVFILLYFSFIFKKEKKYKRKAPRKLSPARTYVSRLSSEWEDLRENKGREKNKKMGKNHKYPSR